MQLPKLKFLIVLSGFLASLVLSVSGCGPSKGSLTGKVTLDGTPLKGGRVDFGNKSGGNSASVEIAEDGTYSLPELTAGDYTITVTTDYLMTPSMGATPRPGSGGMGGRPPSQKASGIPKENKPPVDMTPPEGYKPGLPGESAKRYVKIPAKYADSAQSGLTYTFAGGTQAYNIPLAGK